METGLKTIQTTNHLESHIKKELSIQISLSGFSFCILNRSASKIEYLEWADLQNKSTPEAVLEALKKAIVAEPLLTQAFDTIIVLFQNELSTLVPEQLFEEQHAADYLKFSSKIIKTDFISWDTIAENKCVNVYVPYMNINNYLFDLYGEFEYKHGSTVLMENILSQATTTDDAAIHIHVEPLHFEMVVVKHGALQLYNRFDYSTKEDFIYFILFAIEQLKLNPETVIVNLSGAIAKDDELYEILYTYVRHVQFNEPNYPFTLDGDPTTMRRHSLILNSFN